MSKLMENDLLGYGSPEAPYWFIGPEEAGDDGHRTAAWESLGSSQLLDLKTFHFELAKLHSDENPLKATNLKRLFERENTKIQPTWRGVIKFLLASSGKSFYNRSEIVDFQVNQLGKIAPAQTLLLELQGGCAPNHTIDNEKNIKIRATRIRHCWSPRNLE